MRPAPAIAVVAYPVLTAEDEAWVASIRTMHDPQVDLLPPHFTLVFPADVAERAALDDARQASDAVAPFGFVLRSVQAVRNPFGAGGHVFLVPDEGGADLVGLHDRLYRGAFGLYRRLDVAYIPHITVAASDDWPHCEALAGSVRHEFRPMAGRVEAIELLRVGDGNVESAHRLALGG